MTGPTAAALDWAMLGKLLNLCNLVCFYKTVMLPLKDGTVNLKGCEDQQGVSKSTSRSPSTPSACSDYPGADLPLRFCTGPQDPQ